jgi:hypothetical protein
MGNLETKEILEIKDRSEDLAETDKMELEDQREIQVQQALQEHRVDPVETASWDPQGHLVLRLTVKRCPGLLDHPAMMEIQDPLEHPVPRVSEAREEIQVNVERMANLVSVVHRD